VCVSRSVCLYIFETKTKGSRLSDISRNVDRERARSNVTKEMYLQDTFWQLGAAATWPKKIYLKNCLKTEYTTTTTEKW